MARLAVGGPRAVCAARGSRPGDVGLYAGVQPGGGGQLLGGVGPVRSAADARPGAHRRPLVLAGCCVLSSPAAPADLRVAGRRHAGVVGTGRSLVGTALAGAAAAASTVVSARSSAAVTRRSRSSGPRSRRTRSRRSIAAVHVRGSSRSTPGPRAPRCAGGPAGCRPRTPGTRPSPGEVLHAGHLDPRHVAGEPEAADAVPVGVAGEVAREAGPAGEHVDEPLGVVGVDAEVGLAAGSSDSGFQTWWWPNTSTGRSLRGGELVEPLELLGAHLPVACAAGSTVSSTARRTPGSSTSTGASVGERLAVVAVVVAAHVDAVGRRTRGRSSRGRPRTPPACPSAVRSPLTTTASGSMAAISATAPRFITSG